MTSSDGTEQTMEMNEAVGSNMNHQQQRQQKKQQRGAFLPRADLENKSPDDDLSSGSGDSTSSVGLKVGSSRPPQPPANGNIKRKKKHLPVKSSGYGRPSTPIERRSGSNSLPNSPANSVGSVSSIRSTSRLRYGDGTLANVGGGRTSSRAAAAGNGGGSRSMRSRSPSPAPLRRSSSHNNLHHHVGKNKKLGRSRTPSPAMKRPHSGNSANNRSSSSALKRLKEAGRHDMLVSSASKKLKQDDGSFNNHNMQQKQHRQGTQQQQRHGEQGRGHSPSPQTHLLDGTYKDYSSIDADPTPVKEARRLSSIFHNRAAANNHNSAAASSSMANNLSSPLPRANGNGDTTPLSYSKALQKGLVDKNENGNVAALAVGGGGTLAAASSPLSTMKLFQQPDDISNPFRINASNISNLDNSTNYPQPSIFEGYTNQTTSSTTLLSTQLFSTSSGIDTTNLQRILSKSKKSSNDNNTKQWELRKRLEQKEEELGVLRTALTDLLVGKDDFVNGAIKIEQGLRGKIAEVQSVYNKLNEEKEGLETEVESQEGESQRLKLQLQELQRECDACKTKFDVLSSELSSSKDEVGKLQQTNTDNAVSLALLQSKLDETTVQKEEALGRVEEMEVAHVEAVKVAEAKVAEEMDVRVSSLQAENETLLGAMKVRQENEEEVCKLLGVDVTSVDFEVGNSDGDTEEDGNANSFVAVVRQRFDDFQQEVKVKEELEKSLESCMSELERAEADNQTALETVATKEREMSELTKSIGDIQRSGQDREQEVANQRKAAEDRATAAESQLQECRDKLLALGYEKKSLDEALESSKAACASHETTIANLQQQIADGKIGAVQHDSQLQLERDLRSKAEEKEGEERAERIALAAQLNAQVQEHAQSEKALRDGMEGMERALTEQIRLKEQESTAKDAEIEKCRETITALEAQQTSLKESLSEQKSMLEGSKEEEIGRLKGEIASLESKLKSEVEKLTSAGVASDAKVQELEAVIKKGQAERKRMHNIIQELRGNVRVFARIRPFLPDDGKQGEEDDAPSVSHKGDTIVTVAKPTDPAQSHRFSFDRVFAPSAGQDTVYEEVSEFVQSALDGYNVCLFSYGQTGSGKTHTMQGAGTGVMRGLIPRSIEQIGLHKSQMESDGWSFAMEVSFLEIYNESLRDLLRVNLKEEDKHEIKVGSDGRRTVTNLTIKAIDPNDKEAVDAVLTLAAKRRSTASTDMNATSSRSHSVFTLNITAKRDGKLVRGTLNLVDLAGSERLDRSNATGQHAREAMSINKSLSSLADVFTAIGQKQSHVPFRNSRLTYLLQPALSGDGKTCMLVNISPTEASVQESLCSLRFASKVNKCELGKAKRTVEEVKSNGVAKRGNATSSKSSTATSRNVKRKL